MGRVPTPSPHRRSLRPPWPPPPDADRSTPRRPAGHPSRAAASLFAKRRSGADSKRRRIWDMSSGPNRRESVQASDSERGYAHSLRLPPTPGSSNAWNASRIAIAATCKPRDVGEGVGGSSRSVGPPRPPRRDFCRPRSRCWINLGCVPRESFYGSTHVLTDQRPSRAV